MQQYIQVTFFEDIQALSVEFNGKVGRFVAYETNEEGEEYDRDEECLNGRGEDGFKDEVGVGEFLHCQGAEEDEIESDEEDIDFIDNSLSTPPDVKIFSSMKVASRISTPAVQGRRSRSETVKKQVVIELDNFMCNSLSPNKKNMRRGSDESDQIDLLQRCSASLVAGNPIVSNRIPSQLKDVTAGSGHVPCLALVQEEIVVEEVNVADEKREKEAVQSNDQCPGCSLKYKESFGKEFNVEAEESNDCLDLGK